MYYTFEKRFPVNSEYDVIIIGGGIAGVSAALAASRQGVKVLIIEKQFGLGGLATFGLVSYYLPVCNGKGMIVSTGIPKELFELARMCNTRETRSKYSPGSRMQTWFIASEFQIMLERLLLDNGCTVQYDTAFSDAVFAGTRCTGLVLLEKEGFSFYKADAFIDATGEAAVFESAGFGTVKGENSLSCWYYALSPTAGLMMRTLGADAHEAFDCMCDQFTKFSGATSAEATEYMISSRKAIYDDNPLADTARDTMTVSSPAIPQLRCVRRIIGCREISNENCNLFEESSIGCASDWRVPDKVYEIPFLSLLSDQCDNIIAAGRCISAKDDAYEVLRCIPQSAVTGEAAGTAAALYTKNNKTGKMAEMDIYQIQSALKKANVLLHNFSHFD